MVLVLKKTIYLSHNFYKMGKTALHLSYPKHLFLNLKDRDALHV